MPAIAIDEEPNEAARQIIDAEILKLRLRIAELSSTRNSLAPISRLPAELLTIIWIYARDASPLYSKSKMAMTISWVSVDWRRTSQDWSGLWSHIDIDHYKGVRAFLAHSRQVPLVLTLHFERSMDYAIFQHLHRVRYVDLSCGVDNSDARKCVSLNSRWSAQSPMLDTLSLTRTNLPPVLFTHPPPLHSLHLKECSFKSLPLLAGLTSLIISSPTRLIAVTDFLKTLQRLPNLVTLSLDHVFSRIHSPFTPAAVELSKLQALNIAELHQNPVPYLFQNISIPGNTETNLLVSPASRDFNLPGLLASYCACRISPAPIHTLEVSISLLSSQIKSSSEIKILEQGPNSSTRTTISIGDAAFGFNPFSQSSTSLNLSSLQRLDLTLTGGRAHRFRLMGINEDDWNTFYGSLQRLRIVKATGPAAHIFLDLLAKQGSKAWGSYKELLPPVLQPAPVPEGLNQSDSAADPPESSAPNPRAPLSWNALRELILVFPTDDPPFMREQVNEVHLFVDLLIRKEIGIGLTSMRYSDWPNSARLLQALEGVVGEVLEQEP
ncbi:hypothetical protein BDN72DRAFT_845861 [Pluteus cervinus]|uniref:Uncharacterized protein n=1 Tax=Pluteus cervinus TaxID=181527 RepID=A0ACD3AHR2_9AGAR|nr:hypothetical protein BDN72DRAFT_845861 [Pluteus cervinus]